MANVVKLYYVDTGTTYKQWEILPNRLLVVDSISDYLATKSAMTLNNFQYIKNDLELGINVDLSQSYSQPKTTTSFKYVSIQNNGEQIHYYFIKKIIWRSKTCIRFELVMDVLNTFKEGSDYIFKENTRIIREHKDRFSLYNVEILFTLDEDSVYIEGSLSEDEGIDLYGEAGGNTYLICPGEFIYYDDDKLRILIDNSYTIDEVKRKLQRGFNQFIVQSDSSNYISFKFTSYQIFPKFMRKIDLVSEGINPILNHGEGDTIQDSKNLLSQNWYLLYRNQNNPSESLVNPVDCFLIPENSTAISTGVITSGQIKANSLENNKLYYIPLKVVGSTTAQLDAEAYNQSITLSNGVVLQGSGASAFNYALVSKNDNGKIDVIYNRLDYDFADDFFKLVSQSVYNNLDYITINQSPTYYNNSSTSVDLHDLFETLLNTTNRKSFTYTSSGETLSAIENLDKTDAKNIKLIKLPYCPYDFSIVSSKIDITNTDWNYEDIEQADNTHFKALRLSNLNINLEHTITPNISPFSELYMNDYTPALTDLRKPITSETEIMESKLFHSDFYNPTLVYDSFAFKVDLEKCAIDYYKANNKEYSQNIKFTMTKTINSKFMFTIKDYISVIAESNFYKVLPIARNNEVVLYNVPYINYIRTGFNYDVKAKNLQNVSNYVGLGLSAASVGASLLLPSVPLKVAGVVASLVSMAMSVKNTVVSTINSENAIRQKQEQYKNQAASVVGSDDVDLMSEYCDNRLKYIIYKPNDLMLNLLNDLFFYAGYSSNRMGIPTHNNRINFDYLECEASIEKVASIPDECLNELINCFKAGVCYIHKTNRASNKWDFEQKYENWESNLFE